MIITDLLQPDEIDKFVATCQQDCGNFSCVVQATYILSRHLTRSKFSVSLHEHDRDLKIVVLTC